MISIVCAIMFAVLASAASALYVALRYEKRMRKQIGDRIANLEKSYSGVYEDCARKGAELARLEGIEIGREGGTIQQMLMDSLKNGQPVSLRMGRRAQQDA